MLNKDIRKDFPILNQEVHSHPLIYLDNAATTQKPLQVLSKMTSYYEHYNANPHRGAHYLSHKSTELYEKSRKTVADFIGATQDEIIFTRNTSEAINMVARGYIKPLLQSGDEVVTSIADHHSCMLPLRQVAKEQGASLKYLTLNNRYEIDLEDIDAKITSKTKVIFLSHVTNVFGTLNPIEAIIKKGRDVGATILIDGAQAVPHQNIHVKELDADFYCFSGHKMLGPLGIGVLYGKKDLLEKMNPIYYGGSMVDFVDEQDIYLKSSPHKFEAGTPPVAEAIGLAEAIVYLQAIGMNEIEKHEKSLMDHAVSRLDEVIDATFYLPPEKSRTSILAFSLDGIHPHDVASVLDMKGIAVRSGFHCAGPLHQHLKLPPTCRASFYLYNTLQDVDVFIDTLKDLRRCLYGHT